MKRFERWLSEHRDEVLQRWLERTLAGYPAQSSGFLHGESDPFRNPIGSTTRASLAAILDALCGRGTTEDLAHALHAMVQVRAVQQMEPSRAVGFTLDLRRVVAAVGADHEVLVELQDHVDELSSRAFDAYAACRERLARMKVNEEKARTWSLLKRAGAIDMDQESKGGRE